MTNIPATWWFFDRVLFQGGSARWGVVPVFVTLLNRPLPLLPFWEPNGKGKVCWMWTLSSSNIHNTSRFNLKHWKWVLGRVDGFNTLQDLSSYSGIRFCFKPIFRLILCNGWKRSKRILSIDMGHLLWTIQYIRVFSTRKGCVIWTVGHSHSYWHKWETVFNNF